ncbi:MAG: response regulator transcription factor [Gammaproteobacteria bacterium]|nr:response regulator transcription factor [Gammaproteobacteria bacterium]
MTYLLIDDDQDICELLKEYFEQFQIKLHTALTPSSGLLILEEQEPQCIILDVMLPEMDGFSLVKKIREFSDIPIIMLTARGDVTDRIIGLEIGADDYLPKPFEPRELMARCQSLVRRINKETKSSSSIRFVGIEINTENKQVYLDKEECLLTSTEYETLALLAKNPGKVFSRDDLLNEIKGVNAELFSRSIDIMMSRLRKKLKNEDNRQYIQTVWGRGYQFVGEKE